MDRSCYVKIKLMISSASEFLFEKGEIRHAWPAMAAHFTPRLSEADFVRFNGYRTAVRR